MNLWEEGSYTGARKRWTKQLRLSVIICRWCGFLCESLYEDTTDSSSSSVDFYSLCDKNGHSMTDSAAWWILWHDGSKIIHVGRTVNFTGIWILQSGVHDLMGFTRLWTIHEVSWIVSTTDFSMDSFLPSGKFFADKDIAVLRTLWQDGNCGIYLKVQNTKWTPHWQIWRHWNRLFCVTEKTTQIIQ